MNQNNQSNRPNTSRDRQEMRPVNTASPKTTTRQSPASRPTVVSNSVSEPTRNEGVASRRRREKAARSEFSSKLLFLSLTVLVVGLAAAYIAACQYIGADPARLGESLGLLFKTLAGN